MRRLLPALLAIGFTGCSNNNLSGVGGGPADAGTIAMPDLSPLPPDMTLPDRDPTDHPMVPGMDNNGGPVMSAMEVWTIVWQGDQALGDETNTFDDWMLNSDDFWVSSLSQYGVGKGIAKGVIVLPDQPPSTLDDSAIGPMIKAHIADGLFPQPNKQTLFSFVIPKKTKSTMQGGTGCQDYGGYHSETRVASGSKTFVPYAVNLQCSGFGGVTPFDSLTEVVSHELAEVATDPHPFTSPTYSKNYNDAPLGGEIGDLCTGLDTNFAVTIPGAPPAVDGGAGTPSTMVTYYVTRLWSNAAAAANNADPCVPAPKPYFNVAVDPPHIDATIDSSKTTNFDAKIDPFAYGDVGQIKWKLATQPGPGVTISPTSGTNKPGETIHMTISIDPSAQGGSYPMYFVARSTTGGGFNQWVGTLNLQ